LPIAISLARAGRWFLESGIQEPRGGVARFYAAETGRNRPVSTEITGYTASALVYLFHATGREIYLDRARVTANFLADHAWDAALATFPFEHPSPSSESAHRAYFFDCGIVIRGLMAVWRETREPRLLDLAQAAAKRMLADFHSGEDFHPILELPGKEPLERTAQWSRSSACYQLKSALAWLDVFEETGDSALRDAYFEMLGAALKTHKSFLPADTAHKTMDRLHACCYFLEALTPVLDSAACADAYRWGIDTVARYLEEIAPAFVRSDVRAQLLRARIYGSSLLKVDEAHAQAEVRALLEFQMSSDDVREDGGFRFGIRGGELSSHVNPVSTAFALQALGMWSDFEAGNQPPCRQLLI
jgi:hypothetical protein